jgi:RND family efflux transporter MFP subunit
MIRQVVFGATSLALFLGSTAVAQESVFVRVVKPELRKIARTVDQPGAIRADLEAPLIAKVSGYVKLVRKDIGDVVKEGDVLAEISVPELDAEAKHKEALVKQARSAVDLAKIQTESIQAQISTSKALIAEAKAGLLKTEALVARWRSEAQRLTALAKNNVVDEQARDEVIFQLRSAESAHEESKAKVVSAEAVATRWQVELRKAAGDVLAEEAKLEVANAELLRVRALVEYKTIRAPFDGTITRRLVDPGHFLQLGKSDVLLSIANFAKVRVQVDVPELDAALLKKGDAASIRIQALGDRVFAGEVSRLSLALDPQSRTLRAEIDLSNADGVLRPGMYAYVKLSLELPAVRTVPANALFKAGETMACFLVRDGKAVRVRVKAGRSDGNYFEVVQLQKGIEWIPFTGDEMIIANPPANLADGSPVTNSASDK